MTGAPPDTTETAWRQQRPRSGALVLDHVAHFVPDIAAATKALDLLGFTLTPLSVQHHRVEPGASLIPAGAANRCAMLQSGYLEFLTPAADTPIAQRLRAAIDRYTGVHLVCFGTADSAGVHERLATAGFAPLPPVALQRQIESPQGEATARFTVTRVPPEAMPEGRIQVVEHHTPELLWQPRWLTHANAATELAATILCVDDPKSAAQRYARFAGGGAHPQGRAWVLETARGALVFIDPASLRRELGLSPPILPWIVGPQLRCENPGAARAHLARAGLPLIELSSDLVAAIAPPALGGVYVFGADRRLALT